MKKENVQFNFKGLDFRPFLFYNIGVKEKELYKIKMKGK